MAKSEESKTSKIIIQFESEDFYQAVVNQILYTADIQVAAAARNKREAEQLLGKIIKGEIKPDLAIIDTLLEDNHTEGEKIAAKIKEVSPETKIIAYTIWDEAPWADYHAIKSNKMPAQTITKGLTETLKIDLEENPDAASKYNYD